MFIKYVDDYIPDTNTAVVDEQPIIVEKQIKEASLQVNFNPTESDTNKVIDVFMDNKANCSIRIRSVLTYKP